VTSAARIQVAGVVQGVGFRPFVYNLARERGLCGWVNNTAEGVTIVVEGDADTVTGFAEEVRRLAPPMSVIETISSHRVEPEGFSGFEIRESEAKGDLTLVAAAYNAGAGSVQRFGGVPPYSETQAYVEKVQALYARYRAAMGRPTRAGSS
jgi:acylphosphatase